MADFTQEQLDEAVRAAVESATGKITESMKKLEANNAALVGEKKTALAAAADDQAKAVAAAEAKARKDGDFDAMDASWKKKYANLEAENKAAMAQSKAAHDEQSGIISELTAGATVATLAGELALKGSEGIFGQIIQNRVGVEIRDGEAITVIKDKSGKPSAATLDDFKKELLGDAGLKPLLAGSQGSGGGAAGQNASGGQSKTMKRAEYELMTPQAQAGVDFESGLKLID